MAPPLWPGLGLRAGQLDDGSAKAAPEAGGCVGAKVVGFDGVVVQLDQSVGEYEVRFVGGRRVEDLEARGAGGRGGRERGFGTEPALVVVMLCAVVSPPVFAGGEALAAAIVGGAVVDDRFEGCCLEWETRINRRVRFRIGCGLELRTLWVHDELLQVLE